MAKNFLRRDASRKGLRRIRAVRALSAVAVTLAALSTTTLSSSVSSGASTLSALPSFEKGINITFYDTVPTPSDFVVASQSIIYANYVKALGANVVTIGIPLWIATNTSNRVFAGIDPLSSRTLTPTPGRVAILVDALHGVGLGVRLRPYVNEGVTTNWRGQLAPSKPQRWFDNYTATLASYAAMAQAHHVESFVVESELQSLGLYPQWDSVINSLRSIFNGNLEWNSIWGGSGPQGVGYSTRVGTSFGVDTYPELPIASDSSLSQVKAAWYDSLNVSPLPTSYANTLMQEVGIPAQAGMYQHPWHYAIPTAQFMQAIQVNWFTAACKIAKRYGFLGVSFNSLFLLSPLPTRDPTHPQFLQPKAIDAIRACFS